MQKLIIDNEKVYLPSRWSDITIKQFFDIQKIVAKVSGNEYLDDEYYYSSLFAIFTDTKPSTYFKMKVGDITVVKSTMAFLLADIKSDEYKKEFEYKNYVFNIKNFNDFSFGEYIDTQHLADKNDLDNVVKLLSIMIEVYEKKNVFKLRFRNKKLQLSQQEKEQLIMSMPCTKLKAIQSFFLRGQKQYVTGMVSSMEKQARHLRMKAYLQMAGHIISGLWMPVTRMSQKWKRSLSYRLRKS